MWTKQIVEEENQKSTSFEPEIPCTLVLTFLSPRLRPCLHPWLRSHVRPLLRPCLRPRLHQGSPDGLDSICAVGTFFYSI